MKRIVPLLLFLLLLCGCAGNIARSPAQTPTQMVSSGETAAGSTSLPPQKLPPDWHYDLMEDGLFRTDQNTGDAVKISGQDNASDIIITEDWIFFNDDDRLYRMDNENRRELLLNEDCRELSLNAGWLYYISNSKIFKMKPDGNEKEKILQRECNGMVLSDEYIFYILDVPVNDEDWNEDGPPLPLGELHRVDLNGDGDVNLGVLLTALSIYGNTVYFSDSEDNYFYSMNPETLEKTAAYEGHFIEDPYFGDGYVFFVTDRNLYKMSLAEGTMTQLTEVFSQSCGILDGYIYAYFWSGEDLNGLYRIRINGADLEKVK